MKALEKIRELQDELNDIFIEREREVEGLLAALLAGVHVLLLGPPGTAKSQLANILCSAIDEATFFEWLLTKFTVVEEVFGPMSLKGIENDEYRRITSGKLPEAHVAFLDEIFKCNSALLNSLLSVLNERKFYNNGKPVDVPLQICVGASNELPQGEELGALYDRFPLRYWVKYIEDDASFCDLLAGKRGASKPSVTLTFDELKALQDAVEDVKISDDLLEKIRKISHELREAGISASDRRWKTAVNILKAFAFLRHESDTGRNAKTTEVTDDELEALTDIMWDEPESRKKIIEIVAPYANPFNLKAVEYEDQAVEVYELWSKAEESQKDQKAMEANASLKEIQKAVEQDLEAAGKRGKKLETVLGKVQEQRKKIIASLDLGADLNL